MTTNPNGPGWEDEFLPPVPPPPNPNGPDWVYKYAPKEAPPSTPQTVSNPLPIQEVHNTMALQTYQAIQEYNNGLSNFANNLTVWTDTIKGVAIHKIDEPTAIAISERIKPSAALQGLPLTYALACLAIESTLDPECQNGNLGPGESNILNDPLGYDMGIAQLKLRYLVNIAKGVVDATTAKAFALDIDEAIPYFCSLMGGNVLWAENVIAANTSSVPDPRLSNKYLLGTAAYNFGKTGVMTYYETGQFPSHCQHVMNLEQYFATKLGLTSIFASIQ